MHRRAGCSCGLLEKDMDAMKATFDDGHFGLLEISEHEDIGTLNVNVVSVKDHVAYIALSHVWADGLGNPVANALPRCQLAHVATVAKELAQAAGYRNLPVWLDTLCCPVSSPAHRNQCLRLMRNIYRNAALVLVLDAQLAHFDSRYFGSVEICARLMFSGWSGRLWTLQEGALAQKLWVQLKDRAVDLNLVERDLDRMFKTDLIHHQLLMVLIAMLKRLRKFGWYGKSKADLNIGDIHIMLRTRSVTVPTDEPLCLRTCMNLEQSAVVQAPESERMAAFWQTMGASGRTLSNSIIFFAGPRLQSAGLRWAPTSFLGSDLWPGLPKPMYFDEVAVVSLDGLLVQLPAFEIASGAVLHEMDEVQWDNILEDVPPVFYVHAPGMSWYMIVPLEFALFGTVTTGSPLQKLLSQLGGQAVILQDQDFSEMKSGGNNVANGLIGTMSDGPGNVPSFFLQTAVYVHPVIGSLAYILQAGSHLVVLLEAETSSTSHIELPQNGYLSKTPRELARAIIGLAEAAIDADATLLQHLGGTKVAQEVAVRSVAECGLFFLAGRVEEVKRTWPREEKWCVN